MSNFPGGSAYAMAQKVADGCTFVTERSFRRLHASELDKLGLEIEKVLLEIRGEPSPNDDQQAVQDRNRKIQRLNTCRLMLRTFRQRNRSDTV